MIEREIKKLKSEYFDVSDMEEAKSSVWMRVEKKTSSPKITRKTWLYARRVAFAFSFVVLLFVGTLAVAQMAEPEDTLYPVKSATDQAIEQVKKNIPEFKKLPFVDSRPSPTPEPIKTIDDELDKDDGVSEEEKEASERIENSGTVRSNEVRNEKSTNADDNKSEVRGASDDVRQDEKRHGGEPGQSAKSENGSHDEPPGKEISEEKKAENKPINPDKNN